MQTSDTDTSPQIEASNALIVSFAAVETGGDLYVAVIYDTRASMGGNHFGDVEFSATCNGSQCSNPQYVATATTGNYGDPTVVLSWVPARNGGYVLGPITGNACVTHSLLQIDFSDRPAHFVDGSTGTRTVINPSTVGTVICVGT